MLINWVILTAMQVILCVQMDFGAKISSTYQSSVVHVHVITQST
jgi:hypothetical protein